MATTIKSIVRFTNLQPGVPTSLPHNLKIPAGDPLDGEIPVVPDVCTPSICDGSFEVTADDTNVTVQRLGDGDAVDVLAEWWHTIERAFGGAQIVGLSPKPFVVCGGGAGQPGCFPYDPETFTIFARTTGSDTTGNGTLAKPYATFQRAICDIPLNIPGGTRYIVDITGITETLPPDFTLPAWGGGLLFDAVFGAIPVVGPFLSKCSVQVLAQPKPAVGFALASTLISAADILSITFDVDTDLADVKLTPAAAAAKAWVPGSFVGKLFINDDDNSMQSAIYDNSADTLRLTLSSGAVFTGATLAPPTGANLFRIVDPGATLNGSVSTGNFLGKINIPATCPVAFQGIDIPHAGSAALGDVSFTYGASNLILELCYVGGLAVLDASHAIFAVGSVCSDKQGFIRGPSTHLIAQMFFKNTFWLLDTTHFLRFKSCVHDACTALGESFGTQLPSSLMLSLTEGLIKNSIVDGIFTGSDGSGISIPGGRLRLRNIRIDGAAANGVRVGEGGFATLEHVTGLGNAGIGVVANDGANVRVKDDGTLVTGVGGDIKVGTLAVRTWVDFRAVAPIKNEYDLSTPFVVASSGVAQPPGDELTGAGSGGRSGTRLFQRP